MDRKKAVAAAASASFVALTASVALGANLGVLGSGSAKRPAPVVARDIAADGSPATSQEPVEVTRYVDDVVAVPAGEPSAATNDTSAEPIAAGAEVAVTGDDGRHGGEPARPATPPQAATTTADPAVPTAATGDDHDTTGYDDGAEHGGYEAAEPDSHDTIEPGGQDASEHAGSATPDRQPDDEPASPSTATGSGGSLGNG